MKNSNGNWFAKHKALTIIGVIVISGIIISAVNGSGDQAAKVSDGSSSSNTSQQAKTVFAVGEVIAFDGKEVTVNTVERNWSSGNQFITPESGMEFVKAQVTIENKSSSEASYNLYDWKLQNSQGVIKDPDSSTYSADGALGSGDLAPGGKVSGFLVFQVPQDDGGLTLRYSPSFWSDKKIEITL